MNITPSLLAAAFSFALLSPTQAAVITYLGTQNNFGGGWRDTDVAKNPTYDPNGDHGYGTDGYIYYDGVTPAQSLPSYFSSLSTSALTQSSALYTPINDPSTGINATPGNMQTTFYRAGDGTLFNFTLNATATFIITIAYDNYGSVPDGALYNATSFTVTGPGGVTDTSDPGLGTGGMGSYAFFQVSGINGDAFTIGATAGPSSGLGTIAAVGFEAVPEPSTFALLGLAGAAMLLRRRRGASVS